jgi:hypothetical protein
MSPNRLGEGSLRKSVGDETSSSSGPSRSLSSGESASENQASSFSSSCTSSLRERVAPPGAVPHSRRARLKSGFAPAALDPHEESIEDTRDGRVVERPELGLDGPMASTKKRNALWAKQTPPPHTINLPP